jgi:hypothetical protein
MQLERQISQAIEFHHHLTQQMRDAVASGTSRHTVAGMCRDDQCRLGLWLYGLAEPIKATPRWKCVRDLHEDLHREAARVLGFALAGDGANARAAISYSSPYTGIARRFESELNAWKKEAVYLSSNFDTRAGDPSGTTLLPQKNPLAAYGA